MMQSDRFISSPLGCPWIIGCMDDWMLVNKENKHKQIHVKFVK
jgi:hypothetical protein